MTRTAASIALAIAAFVAMSGLIDRLAPPIDGGRVTEKLAHFEAHKDRYDVLFFGSSLIERGVVPRVFDAAMARQGHPVRSFNFGAGGMFAHEINALIRRVLAMDPGRLRFVVVELRRWHPMMWEGTDFSRRAISWHDATETASLLASAAVARQPVLERLRLGWGHVMHMLAFYLPVGRGLDILQPERARAEAIRGEQRDAPPLERSQGYLPFPPAWSAEPNPHQRRRAFLTDLEGYERDLRELAEGDREAASAASLQGSVTLRGEATAAQVARIRAAGAEPIYIVAPSIGSAPHALAIGNAGLVPAFFAFNDPAAYPELYLPENRFDAGHLNEKGAIRFTALLAERLAPLLAAPRPAAARVPGGRP